MIKEIRKNKLGFTLIETIVSISILSVFIFLIFGSIYYVNKANNNIKVSLDLKNDINPIIDDIVNNIKKNGINYNYYKKNGNRYDINIPESEIFLNNTIAYRKTNNCYNDLSCIEISLDGGVNYKKLTPSNININIFNVYFSEPVNNIMPIVTVVVNGSNIESGDINFSYQKTVEVKKYIK